jgi:membrane protein insertase Oxa1/YidC/SpoIIIJ
VRKPYKEFRYSIMDIIFSIIGFIILAAFIAFALWFGAAIILFVFVSSIFLAVFIVLRSYYLRMRYGKSAMKNPKNDSIFPVESKTTIIDVEFHDVSDK